MSNCGVIHSFESMAALDGKGVRFAVFMSGCSLRCVYCHNPDTWECKGNSFSAKQLTYKIKKYKPYFKNGGGVTFSGGEPLLQADFLLEAIKSLNEEGIGCFLDTSGAVELNETVKRVVDGCEGVILDLKYANSDDYKKYTNADFEKVLKFGDYVDKNKKDFWLRTVIVPNINDTYEAIEQYAQVASRWKTVNKYELLGFHTLGFAKYEQLGLINQLKDVDAMDNEKLTNLQNYLNIIYNVEKR